MLACSFPPHSRTHAAAPAGAARGPTEEMGSGSFSRISAHLTVRLRPSRVDLAEDQLRLRFGGGGTVSGHPSLSEGRRGCPERR